jgi:1-acyl-sn-glycerol-3-phosphate acyltransferase
MPDWLAHLWYDANFCASMTAMTLGFSLRTEGMHHVPAAGPAILISNHQSVLDPILVGLAARRHLYFMSKQPLFDYPAFAWFIRTLNAIPVNQAGIGIEGLRLLMKKLKAGNAIMVFPEGERTFTGNVGPLKPGIHLLIKKTPAPIVPIGIAGAFHAWPRWRSWPILAPLFVPANQSTLAVSIGQPLAPGRYVKLTRKRALSELCDHLRMMQHKAEALRRKP